MQPMALKGSTTRKDEAAAPAPAPAPEPVGLRMTLNEAGQEELNPVKLPEIMPSLRIRQMTPFGNMHVKVSVDPIAQREREVFAQLGKGGDVANSDLEAICRILSLWLRSNGSLKMAMKQLEGIGSSLSVPTKDGRIMSLADGLATALSRYLQAKEQHGLHALLLGTASPDLDKTCYYKAAEAANAAAAAHVAPAPGSQAKAAAPTPMTPMAKPAGTPRNVSQYKLKCPSCDGVLCFEEGCVKCHACGFSQC
jgi:ribonucleoside-diphosphate reductase alpha chain